MVGNSDDETNFPRKLLVTNRQVSNLRKAFANYLSTGLSTIYQLSIIKTQLSKMIQSGGFFGRLLGTLIKPGLPLINNVIKPLAKIVLIPLGVTASASAADAGIHKKSQDLEKQHQLYQMIKWKTLLKQLNLLRILVYY